jgi:hypothetical protein
MERTVANPLDEASGLSRPLPPAARADRVHRLLGDDASAGAPAAVAPPPLPELPDELPYFARAAALGGGSGGAGADGGGGSSGSGGGGGGGGGGGPSEGQQRC